MQLPSWPRRRHPYFSSTAEAERGELLDIGVGGARLHLGQSLAAGTRVMLDVHFPAGGTVTTVRFEGAVTRAQKKPRGEIVVRFHRTGRIFRNELGDFLMSPGTV